MEHSHSADEPEGSKAENALQKPDETPPISLSRITLDDLSQHQFIYRRMEQLMERMQDEDKGIPIRTYIKDGEKLHSVFTGVDLITWIVLNVQDIDSEDEALHVANKLCSHGYILPIKSRSMHVKNDQSYYRYQSQYYYPSLWSNPNDRDYATYLCHRVLENKDRLRLVNYEAENFARLQIQLRNKWLFVMMEAEAQVTVGQTRHNRYRRMLESQERAFWDVHRPMPGIVNTKEIDYRKLKKYRYLVPLLSMEVDSLFSQLTLEPNMCHYNEQYLRKYITATQKQISQINVNIPTIANTYINYFNKYVEYDPFFTKPEPSNPWISNNADLWNHENSPKGITERRVKRWSFDLKDLLADAVGKDHFSKYLDKEFSNENLRFWDAVQDYKKLPLSKMPEAALQIWTEYLQDDRVNVDCHSKVLSRGNMENANRWTFDDAMIHVYRLMKNDSYQRYIRSDMYREVLNNSKKKSQSKPMYRRLLPSFK